MAGDLKPVTAAGPGASESAQDTAEQALYEVRRKIYPRAVTGLFASWRWAMVFLTQAIYYGLPWLTWNDRQAVLLNLVERKFFIFGLVLWPQDVIYLALLLILAAYALFLFTAIAGRLFCGYACPQTVYTEIFLWIERKIEGDRLARIRLDAAPLGPRKLALKGAKHAAWAALGLWTGFTFVGYFTPIRELLAEAGSLALGPWETFWILFYGFATYGNAGWMREQVCKYMCPYARFQSAMFDRDTMIITYDARRGDPRGARSRKADPRGLGLGDCVDCGICVQVCPTGIDIRDGLQYECIGCAACIDGCDKVMEKMGYPKGLVRYSTENAIERGLTRPEVIRRVFRLRTLIYTGIMVVVVVAIAASLVLRTPLKVDVLRDRGALAREVEPGVIENVYRLQIINTQEREHSYAISVEGIDGAVVEGVAQPVKVEGASTRMIALRVRAPVGAEEHGSRKAGSKEREGRDRDGHGLEPGSHKLEFEVRSIDDPRVKVEEKAVFLVPRP